MGQAELAPVESGLDFADLLPEALSLALEIERIERIAAGENLSGIARDHEGLWQGIKAADQRTESSGQCDARMEGGNTAFWQRGPRGHQPETSDCHCAEQKGQG